METLPDTVYLIPYPGQDDFIVWDLTPEPDGIYEDEGESYDPADAVKYIRADSLPQPSTEVPTVPGLYVIDWADSEGKARFVHLKVVAGFVSDNFLCQYHNRTSRSDFLMRDLEIDRINNPTFTLMREDT